MEIIKQWIVNGFKHLVLLENGEYMIGMTSNIYGFESLPKEVAEEMIKQPTHPNLNKNGNNNTEGNRG